MELSNVSLKFNSVLNIGETAQLLNFKTFNQRSYNSLTEDQEEMARANGSEETNKKLQH